jgi:hypothetical protein
MDFDFKVIANEIRTASMPNKRKFFKEKYPEFVKSHPKFFEAILDPSFPLQYLDFMLEQKEKLDKNQASVEEIDKIVYDKLNDHYVNPVIESLPKPQQ